MNCLIDLASEFVSQRVSAFPQQCTGAQLASVSISSGRKGWIEPLRVRAHHSEKQRKSGLDFRTPEGSGIGRRCSLKWNSSAPRDWRRRDEGKQLSGGFYSELTFFLAPPPHWTSTRSDFTLENKWMRVWGQEKNPNRIPFPFYPFIVVLASSKSHLLLQTHKSLKALLSSQDFLKWCRAYFLLFLGYFSWNSL